MSAEKLVSVIIPTYNRADKIGAAIESVLVQHYKAVELIVVDDGSNDQTNEVVKKYPEAKYFLKEHAGQAAARNYGLQHANGELIASLDSDDTWMPGFLNKCVEKLEAEQLDFVFANWEQQNVDGTFSDFLSGDPFLKPYKKNQKENWFNMNGQELRSLYLNACPSPSSSGLIRRSSIKTGWTENIRIGDDWCFYLDIVLHHNCNAAFTMEKLWRKKLNQQNLYNGRKWAEVLEHLYIHDVGEFLIKFHPVLSENELNILKKKKINGLVELSKHHAFRKFNFSASGKLLKQAASLNMSHTLRTIPVVLADTIAQKFKK